MEKYIEIGIAYSLSVEANDLEGFDLQAVAEQTKRYRGSKTAKGMNSVRLSEKLGYEFDHEYTAYEVDSEERTH